MMQSTTLARTPDWKTQWRAKIGGGRSAAAAGIHEYMTPLELYMSMVEGVDINPETKPDMLRGLLLEPVALARLRMLYADLEFSPHNPDEFIYSDKYPCSSDLPDGWVMFAGTRIPVQVKVPTPRNWEKLDESVPDYIQCNCIHSVAMNESPAILLACLNPVTMEIHRQLYEREQDAIDALMEAEERFYNQYIVPRVAPPPRTHNDLKLLWPEHAPSKRVQATDEIESAWGELLAVRTTATHAEECKANLSLAIKTYMEDAEVLIDESGRVLATYKSHPETDIDSKRLKSERPEVWAEFARERPVRVFLPKKPKGGFAK